MIPPLQLIGIEGREEGACRFPDRSDVEGREEIALTAAVARILAVGAIAAGVDNGDARTDRRPVGWIEWTQKGKRRRADQRGKVGNARVVPDDQARLSKN